MRQSRNLLILAFLFGAIFPSTLAQQIPLGEVADSAVVKSKLSTPGSAPFHLMAKIAEKDNPGSDFRADFEMFWVSPKKWRRTIQSPEFSQTLILNDERVFERDIGDYYPFWLHELVTGLIDPLPMLESLKRINASILKPSGSECFVLKAAMGFSHPWSHPNTQSSSRIMRISKTSELHIFS